jgi:hypothetical protein
MLLRLLILLLYCTEQVLEHEGIKFWCYNAGHVLGAAMFMIEIAGVHVLYTGDYSMEVYIHFNRYNMYNFVHTALANKTAISASFAHLCQSQHLCSCSFSVVVVHTAMYTDVLEVLDPVCVYCTLVDTIVHTQVAYDQQNVC